MANGGFDDERFEAQVRALARALPYPPTPDVARAVRTQLARTPAPAQPRRLAWVIILVALLASLLAVPQVRAALIEFFQIGGVRIYLAPTPTGTPTPTNRPSGPTLTPRPTSTFLMSLLDLSGETTLEAAQDQAGFSLVWPPDYGPPDRVFYQVIDHGPLVILVWLDPDNPERVRLSLHQMRCAMCVEKYQPTRIETTSVNGHTALWAEGPYLIRITSRGDFDFRRLIDGHVLIWDADGVTYRLETDLTMDEAVTLAESLK